MLETIINALERFRDWIQRQISPKLYRLKEALIDIRSFLGPWGLYYIEDTTQGAYRFIINSFIKLATLTYDYVISPIINLIKSSYYAIKSIVLSTISILDIWIREIYTDIAKTSLFKGIYDLLRLDQTWPTSKEKANEIATITHSVSWIMFFTLSITPMMLMFVGVPGNYGLTFPAMFIFSFAVGISFGATFAHNNSGDYDKAATTSIIFLALILLGLIYLSISMDAIFINFVSIIIGIGTMCFTIAQQHGMQDSKIFGRFHTTNYMSPSSKIYYHRTYEDDIGQNTNYAEDPRTHKQKMMGQTQELAEGLNSSNHGLPRNK